MLNKIILADDETRWRMLVRDFLEQEGYAVLEASDGAEAVALLRENLDTALVILDIMMPNTNGLEACRIIRSFSQVPILMVTAREDEETEISGIQNGADQFVSKPIRMRAFMERVKSLLRRNVQQSDTLSYDALEIDPTAAVVRIHGDPVPLTPKEFDLLFFLAQKPNVARSREQILQAVWNTVYFGDGRTVDTHVKNLRMKLGSYGDLIRTVRSKGYLFAWKQP